MIYYYILIVIMTFMGALASLFLKKAASNVEINQIIFNKYLYLGGINYILSALINVYVLRFLDYSVVLPLTSLTYIWTMVFSRAFLGEKISVKKVAGVGLIIMGAVLVVL